VSSSISSGANSDVMYERTLEAILISLSHFSTSPMSTTLHSPLLSSPLLSFTLLYSPLLHPQHNKQCTTVCSEPLRPLLSMRRLELGCWRDVDEVQLPVNKRRISGGPYLSIMIITYSNISSITSSPAPYEKKKNQISNLKSRTLRFLRFPDLRFFFHFFHTIQSTRRNLKSHIIFITSN
jgi:hypothetical protein